MSYFPPVLNHLLLVADYKLKQNKTKYTISCTESYINSVAVFEAVILGVGVCLCVAWGGIVWIKRVTVLMMCIRIFVTYMKLAE